jgi:ribosomal protein S6
MEFEAEGKVIDRVERFLKLDENVMRYLTIHLDVKELEAKRAKVLALAEAAAALEAAAADEGKEKPSVAPVA